MVICPPGTADGQKAELSYHTLRSARGGVLLEIELHTGRKHQIRVQLAARNVPILGDRKYGSRSSFAAGIALHSRALEFEHPVRHQWLKLVAPLPAVWRTWGLEE